MQVHNFKTYLRRYNMARMKSKQVKALQKEYDWYKKIVDQMEDERRLDRTWDSKHLLVKFKKIKLFLKTQIDHMKRTLGA